MLSESEASAALVVAIQKKKIDTYEYLVYLSRDTPEGLKAGGYTGKTNAEAVLHALRRAMQEIEKMIQKHEREYP